MRHLNRRQTLAPYPAAVAQDGAPALAGVAAQQSVLPFPANLRRLILAFHKSVQVCRPASLCQKTNCTETLRIGAPEDNSEPEAVKRRKKQDGREGAS